MMSAKASIAISSLSLAAMMASSCSDQIDTRQTGTPATSTAASTAGAGGNGAAGGTGGTGGEPMTCDTPDECGTPTTCLAFDCVASLCVPLPTAKGTVCGTELGMCSAGACVAWAPLASAGAPSARSKHTAVWTGSEMLVWGGDVGLNAESGTGARYDPVSDTWSAMSTTGAPSPRHSHGAVWTGTEMIVFGGFGEGSPLADGARYDPALDSWQPLPPSPLQARLAHNMVWSDGAVLIWGGRQDGLTVLGNGASYAPSTNQWTQLPAAPIASRYDAIGVWVDPGPQWVNGAFVIWGGGNGLGWFGDGAIYQPGAGWTLINMTPGPPPDGGGPPSASFASATAVFRFPDIYIWGGWDGGTFYNEAYILSPTVQPSGYWYNLGVFANPPQPRLRHAAVVPPANRGFFIFGGCGDSACSQVFGDAAFLDLALPLDQAWQPIAADATLSARYDTTVVNSGLEVIVWGGETETAIVGDGARRRQPEAD